MLRSLYAAVSGVKAHQSYLDVTGNNIANVNTVGFKKDVVNFRDMIYQTVKSASAPSPSTPVGGVNPAQIGLGVSVGSIETVHTQGSMQTTGIPTDMAVQGSGYFVVQSGGDRLYTRAGNFALDANGNLVMSGNGYLVQGYAYNSVTDPTTGVTTREKSPTLTGINIPIGEKTPAKATTLAAFRCNLCSTSTSEIADLTSIPGGESAVLRPNTYTSYGGVNVTYVSPTAPSVGTQDDTYYNTTDGKIYKYTNGAWAYDKDAAENTYYYGQNLASGVTGQFSSIYSNGPLSAPTANISAQINLKGLFNNPSLTNGSTLASTNENGLYVNEANGKLLQLSDNSATGGNKARVEVASAGMSDNAAVVTSVTQGAAAPDGTTIGHDVAGAGYIDTSTGTLYVSDGTGGAGAWTASTNAYYLDQSTSRLYHQQSGTPPTWTQYAGANNGALFFNSAAGSLALYSYNSNTGTWTSNPLANGEQFLSTTNGRLYTCTGGNWADSGASASGTAYGVSGTSQLYIGGTPPQPVEKVQDGTYLDASGASHNMIYAYQNGQWVDISKVVAEQQPTNNTPYVYNDSTPANADKCYLVSNPNATDKTLASVDRVASSADGSIQAFKAGEPPTFEPATQNDAANSSSRPATGPVVGGTTGIAARQIVDRAMAVTLDASGQPTNLPSPSDATINAGATVLDTNTGKIYTLNSTRTGWESDTTAGSTTGTMQPATAYAVRGGVDANGNPQYGKDSIYVLDSVGVPQVVTSVLDSTSGNLNVFEFAGGVWKSINDTQNGSSALSPSANSVTTQDRLTEFGLDMMKTGGSDWEDKFDVYDSRGNSYTMNVYFRKVMDRPADTSTTDGDGVDGAEAEWDWYACYTDADGSILSQYGQGAGTMVFGDDGLLKRTYYYEPTPATPDPNGTSTPTAPVYNWTVVEKIIGDPRYDNVATGKVVADFNTAGAEGKVTNATPATYASNMITLDFLGSDYATTLGLSSEPIDGVTNYGSTSTTKVRAQDGYAMGVLNDWTVSGDGTITGAYSNGQSLPIAQVALAMFANAQGLSQEGETCFAETINSGMAQIGAPQSNSAGSVQNNTIEMSNVDLSEEFVNLIRAQRGFQANTRVVTVSDQVLEELINMKR